MEAADEEDYERYCQEAIFRIQILEQVSPPRKSWMVLSARDVPTHAHAPARG